MRSKKLKRSGFMSGCRGPFDEELKSMARLMASKANHQLFGQTEFELRDRVHELGAKALEVAADERQKKGRVRRS
jgi:hypothetical protein